jgi:hypothetical protein
MARLSAFRKANRFNVKLLESYCLLCGLLIGASPHHKVLAKLEKLHKCPVYNRYGDFD